MSYSNFSLKDVKSQLEVSLIENNNLFSEVEDVEIRSKKKFPIAKFQATKLSFHKVRNDLGIK